MQRPAAAAALLVLTSLAACSSGGSDEPTAAKTSAPTPSATPSPERTYVPAPGDPSTHRLRVTIRDKGRSYSRGTCAAINGRPDSGGFYHPDKLGFEGPDKTYELRPLGKELAIPKQGRSLADGTCEATMTATVPYAPRYRVGIAIEGHGISNPETDPQETWIVTKGSSQDVVLDNFHR